MIEKNEILTIAKNLSLRPDTVEKDYVLGWMLHGIGEHQSTKTWAFKGGTSLRKIQFSAANRVCIKLQYKNKSRTVEPLSFRINTKTGNRLFYGYERDAGHVKAYSILKIQSVEITNLSYTEKYPVEISSTGSISMPPIRRGYIV